MQGGTEESVNVIRSQEYINESLSMHRCVRECPVFHEYGKRLSKSLFKKLLRRKNHSSLSGFLSSVDSETTAAQHIKVFLLEYYIIRI